MTTKSVAEKLLIKPETTVWSSHPEHLRLIEPLPQGVTIVARPEQATTALVFGEDAGSLRSILATRSEELANAETLWVAYPKGNRSDINRDSVWPLVAEHHLRPIGQISLGDVWSAMRFRPLRPGEAPFTGGATR